MPRRFKSVSTVVSIFLLAAPASAQIDAVIGGARSVADQAHQKIMENQIIQLVIEAKKNYDASMKIYNQVKDLNQGKGLIHNVTSELGHKAKGIADDEKATFESQMAYRGYSDVDQKLEEFNVGLQRGIERQGIAAVNRYGDAINAKSKAYADSLKKEAKRMWDRKGREDAGRQQGVQAALVAPDLNSKLSGLGLQTNADTVEALNQLIQIELLRDAQSQQKEIVADAEIAQALKFLADKEGVKKALDDSFYLVRLSRAPALFLGTREAMSRLVSILLALFLSAAILYEYARNGRARGIIVPEVIGLPLVFVIFGLAFYDKIMVAFAVCIDAAEQTISPSRGIVSNFMQVTSQFTGGGPLSFMNVDYWIKYLCIGLGALSWASSIVFLWIRFAFFCLLYALGPLFIVMALFEPMRKMTYGWMMTSVHVGLWGLFMRVLSLVIVNSGVAAFSGPVDNIMKTVFSTLVVNLVFLAFGILTPYFTHHILSGHLGGQATDMIGSIRKGFGGRSNSPRTEGRSQPQQNNPRYPRRGHEA